MQSATTATNPRLSLWFAMDNFVKCPICLEYLKNPVELRCNHMCCVKCIEGLSKGNHFKCPVCHMTTIKRSVKPKQTLDGPFKFIHEMCQQMRQTLNIDMNNDQTKKSIPDTKMHKTLDNKQERNSAGKKIKGRPRISNSPKATSITINTNPVIRVKSAETKSKRGKTLKKSEEKTVMVEKQTETQHNRRLVVQMPRNVEVLAPYQKNVMSWLSNSQNQFLRQSQTQQEELKDAKNAKIPKNLKSISQRGVQRRTLPARQVVEQRYQRKCRSLQSVTTSSCTTSPKNKTNPKTCNNSIGTPVFDSPMDPAEVEGSKIIDIDSNPIITKSVICKAVEEKCLEAIDQNATRKIGKKRKKPADEAEGSNKISPDWQRINKLSKKIDRVDGIPKRLRLVTASTSMGKENKTTKLQEDVINLNSQFSTTMISPKKTTEKEAGSKGSPRVQDKSKRDAAGNIKNVRLENISEQVEVSKRRRTQSDSCSSNQSSIVIEYNKNYLNFLKDQFDYAAKSLDAKHSQEAKEKLRDDELFAMPTQSLKSAESNEGSVLDESFLVSTQEVNVGDSNEILESKCEAFLSQFHALNARLLTFLTDNSKLNDGLNPCYSKLSLLHKHLKTLQPKFSSMSLILSRNDGDSNITDITIDASVQTDLLGKEIASSRLSKTSSVHVQTMVDKIQSSCKLVQTENATPTSPRKNKMVDGSVQTTPGALALSPKKGGLDDMRNSLDLIDFDTQAAIKQCERAKAQTFTNAVTEQMPLTAFIEEMQKETKEIHNIDDIPVGLNAGGDVSRAHSPALRKSTSDDNRSQSVEHKARKKLYKSPKAKTPTPSPQSQVGHTSKRVKPLQMSDEEDEADPLINKYIRDDISACFDSESQKLESPNELDSSKVDKYLEDVWSRLKSDFGNSKLLLSPARPSSEEPALSKDKQAVKTAIKANTQDLIAKCEEIMSNTEKRQSSQALLSKSMSKRSTTSQNKSQNTIIQVNPPTQSKPDTKKQAQLAKSSTDFLNDSIFGDNDDEIFENFTTPSPCSSSKDLPKSTLHYLHSDLIYKDSNSSILTNILDDPQNVTAIKVLQDVQVVKPVENIAAVAKSTSADSDEDLIFSTPEHTPTKTKKPDSLSDDLVIAPPPDFQDDGIAELPKRLPPTRTSSHYSQRSAIWNESQHTINLSPIQGTASRPRPYSTPKSTPKQSKPLSGNTNKRVTSTPNLKLAPFPPVFPSLNTKTKRCTQSVSHTATPAYNQLPITSFMRKGETTLSDDGDFFSPDAIRKAQAVVACTRLDKNQMIAINALTKKGLARYSSAFDSTVTHLVVATSDVHCAKDHTIKYVRAVAAGIWVVSSRWVEDSLDHKKLLPEEFYEVHDVGGEDGPKQSRLHRLSKPLLSGFKIHVAPPFELITPTEVEEMITSLGGVTVSRLEDLLPKEDYTCLIVAETAPSQGDDHYIQFQEWADNMRVAAVDFEWLTRSIGAYKLQSLRRFALCSDESLCDLSYPEALMEHVPFSFTEI